MYTGALDKFKKKIKNLLTEFIANLIRILEISHIPRVNATKVTVFKGETYVTRMLEIKF